MLVVHIGWDCVPDHCCYWRFYERQVIAPAEWDLQWVDSIARDLFVVRDPDILEKTEEVVRVVMGRRRGGFQ